MEYLFELEVYYWGGGVGEPIAEKRQKEVGDHCSKGLDGSDTRLLTGLAILLRIQRA